MRLIVLIDMPVFANISAEVRPIRGDLKVITSACVEISVFSAIMAILVELQVCMWMWRGRRGKITWPDGKCNGGRHVINGVVVGVALRRTFEMDLRSY